MNLGSFNPHLRLLAFATTVCVFILPEARAETVVLDASKDNTLFNSTTGSNSNGQGPLFAGRTGGQGPGPQRAVFAFDVAAAIPAGSTVTSVELTLNILQAGGGSGNDSYTLHRLEQDWGEGTSQVTGGAGTAATPGDATWIHTFFDTDTWNNPGGDFESSPSAFKDIGIFGPETWGSTSEMVDDVQGWLNDPTGNFGWILIGDESVPVSSRQFASRESFMGGPQLAVTYLVPEPSSLGIALASLLCGFGRMSRRR